MGDLNIKADRAQDLAKKNQNIYIIMDCNSSNEDLGMNLMLKFRDQISETLVEADNMENIDLGQKDDSIDQYEMEEEIVKESDKPTKRYKIKVYNPQFKEKMLKDAPNVDEIALKRYIYDYFMRSSSKGLQGRLIHNPFLGDHTEEDQSEIDRKTELGNVLSEINKHESEDAINERRSNLLKKLDLDMRSKFGGKQLFYFKLFSRFNNFLYQKQASKKMVIRIMLIERI